MSLAELSPAPAPGFTLTQYAICLKGVVWREALRFLHQRERFVSALVRPLVWLFIFAAGFRSVLGVSIIPPYDTYVLYDVYITPGLVAMIQLFNGMQSSLSMVYDREMGNMRTLLVSPLPRWFLLTSKLVAGASVSILQVPMFFASSALYPLWRVQEGSPGLAFVCELNPFTHAVELIRFAFYGQINALSLAVVLGCTIVFLGAAIIAYDPSRGMLMRREG